MAAIFRLDARATLLQMNALRVAAWGNAEDVGRFTDALQGRSERDDTDAALAAFGLKQE